MANIILWNSSGGMIVRSIGPHQLAQWLTSHGHTVKVIDFSSSMSVTDLIQITERHIDADTLAIGVSSTFWHDKEILLSVEKFFPAGVDLPIEPDWVINARQILETKYTKLKWILGGANSYGVTKCDWIKIHGNAEDQLLAYLDGLQHLPTLRDAFKIQTQGFTFNNINDIDSSEVLSMELGRGCQFKCGFCRYPGIGKKKNTYLRNFDLIEQELLFNYDKFGTTRYNFVDDTVNESKEKMIELANIAQRLPFELEWTGFGRVDLIKSNKQEQILKDSGLKSMFFGIESFGKSASKAITKSWNTTHGKDYLLELKDTWGTDINFHCNFIVGLPGDTAQNLEDTSDWLIDNKIDSWNFVPLSMSRRDSGGFKSDFDKNFENLGYHYLDPTNDSIWTNEHWTAISALHKAHELNRWGAKYMKLAGLRLANLASLGHSFSHLMGLSLKEGTEMYRSHYHSEVFERYVKDQLNSEIP